MAIRWITENDMDDPSNPLLPSSIEAACWLLYKLTGEKYPGVVERTEWYGYERSGCSSCLENMLLASENYGAVLSHSHILYRSSAPQSKIRLRGTPAREIISVTYGDEVLSANNFWLVNSMFLQLKSAPCWDTTKGITVTYTAGIDPPEAGRQAAIRLASEFVLAQTDPDQCSLPSNVTTISRQGVDYTLMDQSEFLNVSRTGIYEIDTFIKAANPSGAKKKPRIFSPDLPGGESRK